MQGKRILLGITGGIAAYKIAFLVRLLKKSGAEVKCILTPASSDFISPLVLATLSENPVGIEFWDKKTGVWTNHVEYGIWADVFLIAPLTANSLAKLANGSCDNLLLATYLSMKGQTIVAPAMDLDMYAHPATKRNLEQLYKDNVRVIPAESGQLASGLEGEGRMAEPETIFAALQEFFSIQSDNLQLQGKKVLITAGPTYEAIDPVRFIGNRSSGKMGVAIADEFAKMGADVTLVLGPSHQVPSERSVTVIKIESAEEMFTECKAVFNNVDIAVLSAAVADYKPKTAADSKIKKKNAEFSLELVKTTDILETLGKQKKQQLLVGFALETDNVIEYAKEKIKKKNLDLIIANSAIENGSGFGVDTNKITIIDKHNKLYNFELKNKREVAKDIVIFTINYLKTNE